jgi:integrase
LKRFLSEDELVRLGAWLDEREREGRLLPGIANAIRLLALTGCRLNEICKLRWEEVNLKAGVLSLGDSKTGAGDHAIGAHAIQLLKGLQPVPAAGFVFHGRDPAEPVSDDSVESAWKRARRDADLHGARLHSLRRTVGTYSSQSGANAFLVRDKLRLSTLAIASRYVGQDAAPSGCCPTCREAHCQRFGRHHRRSRQPDQRPAPPLNPVTPGCQTGLPIWQMVGDKGLSVVAQ